MIDSLEGLTGNFDSLQSIESIGGLWMDYEGVIHVDALVSISRSNGADECDLTRILADYIHALLENRHRKCKGCSAEAHAYLNSCPEKEFCLVSKSDWLSFWAVAVEDYLNPF